MSAIKENTRNDRPREGNKVRNINAIHTYYTSAVHFSAETRGTIYYYKDAVDGPGQIKSAALCVPP